MSANARLTLLLTFIVVLLVGSLYGQYVIYRAVSPTKTIPVVVASPTPTPEVSPTPEPTQSASPSGALKKVVK